jgi:hypothetical protein
VINAAFFKRQRAFAALTDGTWIALTTGRSTRPGAAIELAHREFRAGRFRSAAAVARLIRGRAPDAREPLCLPLVKPAEER